MYKFVKKTVCRVKVELFSRFNPLKIAYFDNLKCAPYLIKK